MPVLLDTGCIVALLDRSEQYHQQCVEAVAAITAPLITCEAVITESCYLLRDVPGATADVLENVERGIFRIPFHLSEHAAPVKKLMKKYASVPMGLADACLVELATQFQTGQILTLDSDFQIYRWGRNRTFDLVPFSRTG